MGDVNLTKQEEKAFAVFLSKIQETGFHEKKVIHTQIMKSELTELKNCINSITNKNKKEILSRLTKLIAANKKAINNDTLVMNTIFNNFTVNSFYSKEYADIYLTLCDSEPELFSVLTMSINNIHEKYYNTIRIANPEDDYAVFCENNKTNDLVKSFTHFIVALYKLGSKNTKISHVVNKEYLLGIIETLIEKIKQTSNFMEAYEYLENICIFIKNIPEINAKQNERISIIANEIQNMKDKSEPYCYFKNKCVFKCMDIFEIINV